LDHDTVEILDDVLELFCWGVSHFVRMGGEEFVRSIPSWSILSTGAMVVGEAGEDIGEVGVERKLKLDAVEST
jgi:hypothetical protein